MKTIKTLSTLFATLVSMTVVAQDSLPFLTSKSALRGYNVERAKFVELQISANSQTGPWSTYPVATLASNHTSVDIIQALTNSVVNVTVVNLKDPVWVWGLVMDENGDELFYGYGASTPVFGKDSYYLPPVSMTLMMNYVSVKFDQPIQYAEMWYVDPVTGVTTRHKQLSTYNNGLWFNPGDSGQGFLVVWMRDGTQRIYDLRNDGSRVHGTSLEGRVSTVSIENLVAVTTGSVVIQDTIPSWDGIGENRTYEITMTEKNYLGMNITSSEGYHLTGCFVRARGTIKPKWYPYSVEQGYVLFPLNIDVYYIEPDWNPSEFRERDPNPPVSGGSGGGEKGPPPE